MQILMQNANVWDVVSAIVLIATAVLVWQQLRLQARNHVLSSLEALISRWDSENMIVSRRHVAEAWLSGRHSFDGNAQKVCDFLQQLGAYYRLGALPKRAIWDSFSFHLEHYFEVFRLDILKYRDEIEDPTLFRNLEEVVATMTEISRKESAPGPDRFNIKRFFENELEVCGGAHA